MEETLQQEKQETEGGIRRRLRDRDLLRKRKAEAEEKETNQEERQRKRSRADEKSGTKRRGRPRKSEPTLEIPHQFTRVKHFFLSQFLPLWSFCKLQMLFQSQLCPKSQFQLPHQVETLCTEARDRGAFELIEDLGPDEEEDLSLLQDKTADEDLTEPPSIIIPEQDKMCSIPTLSSQPPPEYLPGNYSNL
ncbi:unnamed protein product [Pleuronectes platessa]|uniref:Hemogen n=1 Tax=Pleuronectes platessa TaxID=8262 RepID=A0A9N7YR14_PLEPL|nr:unnamed protein product [Pleuronectes platessa]